MIQEKLRALAARADGKTGMTPITIFVWPSKTTPGYTDQPIDFTVDELTWAADHLPRKAEK